MISNCANPDCGIPLRYLRDGRLFQFEVKTAPARAAEPGMVQPGAKKISRGVWHFWLCGHCSSSMTLEFDQFKGVTLRPLHHHSAPQLAS